MNRLGSPGQPGRRNAASGPDASSGEMAHFPRSDRLSRECDEPVLDMILDRVPPPPEAPPEMAALPQLLADLSGPAEPGELAGQAAVLSRFRSRMGPAGVARPPRSPARRESRWRLVRHGPRLAAGLLVAAVGLGGTAAAYAGVLPGPLQDLAHRMINAPAARHVSSYRSGVVPRHKSGVAPVVPGSRHQTPQTAAPGSTNDHGTTGSGTHPAATARPVKLRRSGEPSPQPAQPTRSTNPVRRTSPGKPATPPTPTRPANRTHLPGSSRSPAHPAPIPTHPNRLGWLGKHPAPRLRTHNRGTTARANTNDHSSGAATRPRATSRGAVPACRCSCCPVR